MARFLHILAVFAAGLSAVVQAQYNVQVELDKEKANLGETVKAKCKITKEANAPRFTVMWVKKIGEEDVELATNHFLNDEFKKTGRFTIEYYYSIPDSKREVTFSLTIRDLQSSDSGELGCRVVEASIEVLKELTVMVPVSMIKLNSKDANGTHTVAYVNEQQVTFDEGEVRRMYCHVNGSYPEPEVKMMIGDEDVTSMFERRSQLIKDGPTPGLQALTYEVIMANDSFPILYSYSGKVLSCVASVPETTFDQESVAITVKLAGYKPKFLCAQTIISGVHQRNVNISCVVRADPMITDFKFAWDKKGNDNETLIIGVQNGHYKAEVIDGETEFEQTMVLMIDRVFVQHFRDYHFEAENDLGRTTHVIHLQRDRNIEKLLQEENAKEVKSRQDSSVSPDVPVTTMSSATQMMPDPQMGSSTGGVENPVISCSLLLAGLALLFSL